MNLARPLAALLLLSLAACSSSAPKASPDARDYPALKQASTADIQVVLHNTTVDMTNTTARAFGPSTVWLNKWYSKPIDGFAPGQTLSLPLDSFLDRYSENFKPGGFFATKEPTELVLAQLETKDDNGKPEIVGLVVVQGKPNPD
jgi:hypothetical protein